MGGRLCAGQPGAVLSHRQCSQPGRWRRDGDRQCRCSNVTDDVLTPTMWQYFSQVTDQASLTATASWFQHNVAGEVGGVLHLQDHASVQIHGSTMQGNSAVRCVWCGLSQVNGKASLVCAHQL